MEEELKQKFVGKNFEKIYNKNFSICALIFGPFYYIYRKMILSGSIILLLEALIGCIIAHWNNMLQIIVYILINLAASFLFNSMYRKFVEKKIDKIKKIANSEEKSKDLCVKKGQTSALSVVLAIIVYIGLVLIINFTIATISLANSVVGLAKDSLGVESLSDSKIIIENTGSSSIGKIEGDELKQYISYSLNSKFEEDTFWEGSYKYEEKENDGFWNKVEFSIGGAKELENKVTENVKLKNYNINGKTWTVLDIISEDQSERIHAYTKTNEIYVLITYKIGEDVKDKATAKQYFIDALNSVKFLK